MKTKSRLRLIISLGVCIIVAGGVFSLVLSPPELRESMPKGERKPQYPKGTPLEERYWGEGTTTIAQTVQYSKAWLGKDSVLTPSNIRNILEKLAIIGNQEAVSVMREYMQRNEALLVSSPPSLAERKNIEFEHAKKQIAFASKESENLFKEKLDGIEIYMNSGEPITPEGRILCALFYLIASGDAEGFSTAKEFVEKMHGRYDENTEYGKAFLGRMDFLFHEAQQPAVQEHTQTERRFRDLL